MIPLSRKLFANFHTAPGKRQFSPIPLPANRFRFDFFSVHAFQRERGFAPTKTDTCPESVFLNRTLNENGFGLRTNENVKVPTNNKSFQIVNHKSTLALFETAPFRRQEIVHFKRFTQYGRSNEDVQRFLKRTFSISLK